MQESLKKLQFVFDCVKFCTGVINDTVFRQSKKFNAQIIKVKDSIGFYLFFTSKGEYYRLTIAPMNIQEIIESEEYEYLLCLQGRPSLERKEENRYSRITYAPLISSKEDSIFKLLFPHFLVIKLFLPDNPYWEIFISHTKIHPRRAIFSTVHYKSYPLPITSFFISAELDWETNYYILILLTNSLMTLSQLTPANFELLKPPKSSAALKELFYSATSFSPAAFTKILINSPSLKSQQTHHTLIKKVIITPTTAIFLPPESEISNRVMRKYFEFQQYFLRLNFCEENLERRVWSGNIEILCRFRSILDRFEIFENEYEFLGFSNSQMRSHSCWMVLKTGDSWASRIREDLGDFSGCKTIAKYTSRLGLCFTSTYPTLKIPKSKILQIPDVQRNSYTFSDGIGKISPEFLFEARSILKVDPNEEISAIQIRLGGCKGVVVLAPELDCSIAIRPSMCKFLSQAHELEVCTFAKCKPAYLNRQIISLLYGLGVSAEVFISMQDDMLSGARKALEEEKCALRFLQDYSEFCQEDIMTMLRNGIKIKSDPYLQGMMHSVYNSFITSIRNKARIFAKKSALLMGVLDEYAVLEYEQVYIRVSGTGIIEGKVVIAKNPCLHPGDIKVLEAINKPELEHLVNVIVFPQKGKRPHPNECSGSDLDGDEYFVSWNPDLIPTQTYESMEYRSCIENEDNEINITKVQDFFIKYMKSEALGTIANLHMVYADCKGIYSKEAIELANLHSRAVDYPKTGIPVIVPRRLKVTEWPDFMGKCKGISYESPGILGQLYRSARLMEYKQNSIDCIEEAYFKQGYERFIEEALNTYEIYRSSLSQLMRRFKCNSEFELAQQKCYSYGNKAANRLLSEAKRSVRQRFNSYNSQVDKELLASAYYIVAYSQDSSAFYSFPWIVYDYILNKAI